MSPSMSPFDAFTWFDQPTQTRFNLPLGGPPVRIAGANVRRVALWFSPDVSADVRISPTSGGAVNGLLLRGQTDGLILLQQWQGSLAQIEWWAVSAAGSNITVLELFLRDWPHSEEGPPLAQ